ncbi:hypothetical protein GQ55_2G402100 [Panicum hallii var. hallii]|uniref:Uncharacterized protein n=1 Tax=Panicum hallii var. hallii TaxID=1504633 RepID=A0A2T7EXI1_9POAL|nr:hypothetical protein GQ55_2G402100 [Panicum hallii var. hallii]
MIWVFRRRLSLLVVLVAVMIICFLTATFNLTRIYKASFDKSNFIQAKETCKSLAQDFEVSFMLPIRGKNYSLKVPITIVIIKHTT